MCSKRERIREANYLTKIIWEINYLTKSLFGGDIKRDQGGKRNLPWKRLTNREREANNKLLAQRKIDWEAALVIERETEREQYIFGWLYVDLRIFIARLCVSNQIWQATAASLTRFGIEWCNNYDGFRRIKFENLKSLEKLVLFSIREKLVENSIIIFCISNQLCESERAVRSH